MEDEYLTRKLHTSLKHVVGEEEKFSQIEANLPERHSHRMRRIRKRIGKELILDAKVDVSEFKDVMLDLGSDVNILPNKSLEVMGKTKLVYSPIQLRMADQYCIFPIGRLEMWRFLSQVP